MDAAWRTVSWKHVIKGVRAVLLCIAVIALEVLVWTFIGSFKVFFAPIFGAALLLESVPDIMIEITCLHPFQGSGP